MLQSVLQKVRSGRAAVASVVLAASTQVHAEIPDSIMSKFSAGEVDAEKLAWAGLLIIVAVAIVKYIRRGA